MPKIGYERASEAASIQTKRVTTGAVAGTGQADVTVTWDTPFPDANYTVSAILERDTGGEDLRVRRVRTISATQVVVNVVNNAITSQTGVLHAIGIAD